MEYKIGDRFILRDPEDNYDGEVYTLIKRDGAVALSRLPNWDYEDDNIRPPTRSGFYNVKRTCCITEEELNKVSGTEMGRRRIMIKIVNPFEEDYEQRGKGKCQR